MGGKRLGVNRHVEAAALELSRTCQSHGTRAEDGRAARAVSQRHLRRQVSRTPGKRHAAAAVAVVMDDGLVVDTFTGTRSFAGRGRGPGGSAGAAGADFAAQPPNSSPSAARLPAFSRARRSMRAILRRAPGSSHGVEELHVPFDDQLHRFLIRLQRLLTALGGAAERDPVTPGVHVHADPPPSLRRA
jgi:hypothetical protein